MHYISASSTASDVEKNILRSGRRFEGLSKCACPSSVRDISSICCGARASNAYLHGRVGYLIARFLVRVRTIDRNDALVIVRHRMSCWCCARLCIYLHTFYGVPSRFSTNGHVQRTEDCKRPRGVSKATMVFPSLTVTVVSSNSYTPYRVYPFLLLAPVAW